MPMCPHLYFRMVYDEVVQIATKTTIHMIVILILGMYALFGGIVMRDHYAGHLAGRFDTLMDER